jgi:hypothetical protein
MLLSYVYTNKPTCLTHACITTPKSVLTWIHVTFKTIVFNTVHHDGAYVSKVADIKCGEMHRHSDWLKGMSLYLSAGGTGRGTDLCLKFAEVQQKQAARMQHEAAPGV